MTKKYKASSISTDACNQVYPKKDLELLSLGSRVDGGPQMLSKKKAKPKVGEIDLGKYMSIGKGEAKQ